MEKQSKFDKGQVRRIAIFRALQLGDMLCAVPAIRAIKREFPTAEMTLIGLPGQRDFAWRFEHYFSSFIAFPGWPGLPEQVVDFRESIDFIRSMQDERFDLVIQMQGNGYIVNPMCVLFGAKWVAGLRKEEDFCPDESLFPVMQESEHEILRFMKIAGALGAQTSDTSLEFPILSDESGRALTMIDEMRLRPGRHICIHPGARDPRRRWKPEHFARVADALACRGFQILLTGSEAERDVLRQVAGAMHCPVLNLVEQFGHVGIGELAALIRCSAGLVTNDTGVSHVASALGIRSVVVFSEYSDPVRWKPLNHHLHKAILAEEALNVMYVVNTVLRHLDLGVESNLHELV